MTHSQRKFDVPLITDDETDEIPQYFKPGTILQASQKTLTLDADEQKQDTVRDKALSSTSGAFQERDSCQDKPQSEESKEITKDVVHSEPTTRFESEFGNLRSSKFYDKALESSSSASGNVQVISEKGKSSHALLVNPRQRGNPLLKHIRSVPWEFSEIEPDYVVGKSACALFLSLKYHNLFPNYIHDRLKALGKSYSLRVILVQVDVLEPSPPLKDLSVIAILAECTLMVSWSAEEAGNYLETYKMFENKSADFIKEKQDDDNYSQLIDCLTTIRSVNKTDAMVLLSTFKTLKGIIEASVDNLAMCPGIGPLKAKRLYDTLRKPLKNEFRSIK